MTTLMKIITKIKITTADFQKFGVNMWTGAEMIETEKLLGR